MLNLLSRTPFSSVYSTRPGLLGMLNLLSVDVNIDFTKTAQITFTNLD